MMKKEDKLQSIEDKLKSLENLLDNIKGRGGPAPAQEEKTEPAEAANELQSSGTEEEIPFDIIDTVDEVDAEEEILSKLFENNFSAKPRGQADPDARHEGLDHRDNISLKDAITAATNVDGYYNLAPSSDGLSLTVFKPSGAGRKITHDEVLDEIFEHNIKNIDKNDVTGIVLAADGQPHKIAEWVNDPSIDARLMVYITKNGLEATATLTPPQQFGRQLLLEDAIERVEEKGLKNYNREIIETMINDKLYNNPLTIASGIPPQPGRDGTIEYTVSFGKEIKAFAPGGADKIDYRETSVIENVIEGQIIGRLIPPSSGIDGETVTGERIKASQGREIRPKTGRNIIYDELKGELRAGIDGQVTWVKGTLSIEPVYNINGNVNYETGNVRFIGTVVVRGNVEEGFRVTAGADIIITGSCQRATLEAEGNITVINGIIGKDDTFIKCTGRLTTKYIENARVNAAGIKVSEYILHSYADSSSYVTVWGKKGAIIGGKVRANDYIVAKSIGSVVNTKTSVEAGVNPEIREKLTHLEFSLSKDRKTADKIKMGLETLKKMRDLYGSLAPDKERLLRELQAAQGQLAEKLRRQNEQIDDIVIKLQSDTRGEVYVSDNAYPGVRIMIRNILMLIEKPFRYTTFYSKGDEMKVRTFDYEFKE